MVASSPNLLDSCLISTEIISTNRNSHLCPSHFVASANFYINYSLLVGAPKAPTPIFFYKQPWIGLSLGCLFFL
jgi:hypothetical protein